MEQKVDVNQLLQIIGAKEVEIIKLREMIAQLNQEKQSAQTLNKDSVE